MLKMIVSIAKLVCLMRKKEWRMTAKRTHGLQISPGKKLALCLVVGSIVIAAVITFSMLNYTPPLPVNEAGLVEHGGEPWLLYNDGYQRAPRYRRYGSVQPAEGFTLEKTDYTYDENVRMFYFVPEAADTPVARYYVMVANGAYDKVADETLLRLSGDTAGEVSTMACKIGEHRLSYYSYSILATDTENVENAEAYQAVNAYVEADKTHAILIAVEMNAGEEAPSDEAIQALLASILEGIVVD